ncbi:phosphoribosylaminoimidazolesuccinocarboxamide synthase [Promicromonospora sp. NPDC052451]|uniref:phosphoribosylaminoimidazolesuccinocarboxamide synthase n=1 Tax=Promicromonospora sp. NPDC052451 TaxID=3364407 RepID=UPI0037CA7F4B
MERAPARCAYRVSLGPVELIRKGKVREVYADGDDVILVASDRVSVYDVVLPTAVPDKGAILTQLSLWWFRQFADLVPNHVISEDVPEEWAGRAIRCKKLSIVPVECIARGYLAGGGLDSYNATGTVSGVTFPPGLVEADRLPEPVFTPSTKADEGHDEYISVEEIAKELGAETTDRLRELTLAIYERGAEIARERGVIIADTKLEFGFDADGVLTLADEVLTPDSSRFWKASEYEPGRGQWSYDKQFVRDWSSTLTGWDRTYPGPEIPDDVVTETRARYVEIYEQLTGDRWA